MSVVALVVIVFDKRAHTFTEKKNARKRIIFKIKQTNSLADRLMKYIS